MQANSFNDEQPELVMANEFQQKLANKLSPQSTSIDDFILMPEVTSKEKARKKKARKSAKKSRKRNKNK
jgi:hypothetical protein